ncbi:MFS transporter [Actinomadura sp. CNU-125]|uniref:MFS transporter n=1 Tax=Actinomadura sp. CNU-125 TaxID=1904961 RepID=UPI000A547F26|nr:MFS transporter [Actinomadura sp. CNU-125]
MVVGTLLGSRYGDRWHGRSPGRRVRFGAIGLAVGTAGLAGAVLIPALPAQVAFYCLANIGFSIAIPNLTAAGADASRGPPRARLRGAAVPDHAGRSGRAAAGGRGVRPGRLAARRVHRAAAPAAGRDARRVRRPPRHDADAARALRPSGPGPGPG